MCCIANYTSSTIRDSLFRGNILGSLAVHFNGLSDHLSGSRVGHIVFIGCLWDETVDTDDGWLVLTIAAAQGDQYSQTSKRYHYRKGFEMNLEDNGRDWIGYPLYDGGRWTTNCGQPCLFKSKKLRSRSMHRKPA